MEKVVPKIYGVENLKNRTGAEKRKCAKENLVMVCTLLDEKKADLLNFFASNALRLPAFNIEDVDACQLSSTQKT